MFLYGFAKSDRANIDDDELANWRRIGAAYLALEGEGLKAAIDEGELTKSKGRDVVR